MSHTQNCRIGIVADVQYADRPPKHWYTDKQKTTFDPSRTRNYRQSFEKFKSYAEVSKNRIELDAFIQLGDLVDSSSRFTGDDDEKEIFKFPQKTLDSLDEIIEVVNSFNAKIKINCIGNHDVRTFEELNWFGKQEGWASMHDFIKAKYLPNEDLQADCFAYERQVTDQVTVVNIDTFDLSVYGRPTDGKQFEKATKILNENNPNQNKASTKGMDEPFEKRFVQWTGGVSDEQLKWLDETLTRLDTENKHVVIVTHCPILPKTISVNNDRWLEVCLTWNYDKVLAILENHKCVQVCLTGHNHAGGRAKSETGINFLGIKGLIENSEEGCYGVLKFFDDYMFLEGVGACNSSVYYYRRECGVCKRIFTPTEAKDLNCYNCHRLMFLD